MEGHLYDTKITKAPIQCPGGRLRELEQVMAWRCTDDRPLPEIMLTRFTDACICGDELIAI